MAGYLGNNPSDSSVRIARQIYTTSGVTTDFTFTSGYDPGYIDVYVNGERQTEGTNFTANDGSVVTILNGGVSSGSTVECSAYKTFNVATVTLGEVTDVDDLTITGKITAGSGDIGIATIHSSGIDAGVGVITAASYVGDGSALTGLASTDIINAEQVNVSGSTTTGIATVSTSIVVGSAVTVTATAININPTVTTTIGDSGNVDFSDDAKARFGTGNDLSIYHSGSHSFINDSGTGNLKILSSQVDILNPASNETIATFAENGAVSLYYDNTKRLETLAIGGKVTGELQVTGDANVGGIATFSSSVIVSGGFSINSGTVTVPDIINHDGDTDTAIRFPAADTITAETGGSERLRIDSSGNVGINTTNPNHELTVFGDEPHFRLTHTGSTNKFNALYVKTDGTGVEFNSYQDGTGTKRPIIFSQYDTERLRIDSSGKVLIGTTTEGYSAADDLTIGNGSGNRGITIRSGTASQAAIYFSDGTSGDDEYRGMVFYNHSTEELRLASNAATALTLDSSQNATFAGTVADSIGNLRSIPLQDESSAPYTLVASDAGQCVHAHSSTTTVTVNPSVFSAGQAVSIVNGSGSDITIAQGTSMTLRNSADASTGDRTLSSFGMCTIWFSGASTAYISGAGLS